MAISTVKTIVEIQDAGILLTGGFATFHTFNAATAAPPGSGEVRLNNADPALATEVYLSETDRNSASIIAVLDTFADGSLLVLSNESNNAIYHYYSIDSQTDPGAYRAYTVTYLGGTGALSGNTIVGVSRKGDAGPTGADGTNSGVQFEFDDATTAGPASGQLRFDNATISSATNIFVSETDNASNDLTTLLTSIASGDDIEVVQDNSATNYALFSVSGAPVDNGTDWTIPVTFTSGGLTLSDTNLVRFSINRQGPAGGATNLAFGNRTATTADIQSSTGTDATMLSASGTEAGLQSAADKTKLDGVETGAQVTNSTRVQAALDGAPIPTATVAGADKVLIQDADDSDNLKTVTAQSIADLAAGGSSAGGGYAIDYEFDIATTSGNASGELRLNNGTLASVTEIFVSESDTNSVDVTTILDDLGDGDLLKLSKDGTNYAFFAISGALTDNGTDRTIPVTYRASTGAFADADAVSLSIDNAGSGGGGGGSETITTRQLLAETVVGAPTATLSFLGLDQTYDRLVIKASFRTDRAGNTSDAINITLNGDTTASNYNRQENVSSGGTNFSGIAASNRAIGSATGATADASALGENIIIIEDYAGSSRKSVGNTVWGGLVGAAAGFTGSRVVGYDSTAAITQIDFASSNSANFVGPTEVQIWGEKEVTVGGSGSGGNTIRASIASGSFQGPGGTITVLTNSDCTITRSAVGTYAVAFDTALVDTNYEVVGNAHAGGTWAQHGMAIVNRTVSGFDILNIENGVNTDLVANGTIDFSVIYDVTISGSSGGSGSSETILARKVLATEALGAPAASITFDNIDQTYDRLILKLKGRSDRAGNNAETIEVAFNDDTTDSNYYRQNIYGTNGTTNTAEASARNISRTAGATSVANAEYTSTTEIEAYTGSAFKNALTSFVGYRSGGSDAEAGHRGVIWENTSAITKIVLTCGNGSNFETGYEAELIGEKEITVGGGSSGSGSGTSIIARQRLAIETLASPQATVVFDSIDQTYDRLFVKCKAKDGTAATEGVLSFQYNDDASAGNYHRGNLETFNGGAPIGGESSSFFLAPCAGATGGAGRFGNATVEIPDYASTTNFKIVTADFATHGDGDVPYHGKRLVTWKNNNAITKITIAGAAGNLATGCVFELWGEKQVEVGGSSSGGGLTVQAPITADPGPATVNSIYLLDSSGGAFNVTLPAGSDGDIVQFGDHAGTSLGSPTGLGLNAVTILPDGSDTIQGQANLVLNVDNQSVSIAKYGTRWSIIS